MLCTRILHAPQYSLALRLYSRVHGVHHHASVCVCDSQCDHTVCSNGLYRDRHMDRQRRHTAGQECLLSSVTNHADCLFVQCFSDYPQSVLGPYSRSMPRGQYHGGTMVYQEWTRGCHTLLGSGTFRDAASRSCCARGARRTALLLSTAVLLGSLLLANGFSSRCADCRAS